MGTRSLIAVKSNEKYKIAQYSQWDGYPDGQGKTVLEFLRSIVKKGRVIEFKNQLDKCQFITAKQADKMNKHMKEVGGTLAEVYPMMSRDTGAKILQLVLDSQDSPILLSNEIEFAKDSLFCKWAYVIDIDKNTFEVFIGFNKEPIDKTERFYSKKAPEDVYYPVRLVWTYDLAKLPTLNRFYKDLNVDANR